MISNETIVRKVGPECRETGLCDYGLHPIVKVLYKQENKTLAFNNKETPKTNTFCTKDTYQNTTCHDLPNQ